MVCSVICFFAHSILSEDLRSNILMVSLNFMSPGVFGEYGKKLLAFSP
jgi:hypothetical protein